MGDPLFERRLLVRNVHIEARYLQRNMEASLLAQLRLKYEGVCVAEGYIQQRSIVVTEYSLGRTNLIKGGMDYAVKFQADVCMPHPGQVFRVPVTLKSKIGVHAEMTPIKALLPRDLHIGNTDFESAKEGDEIEFEVVGARFQQGDDSIVVLGKLRTVIVPVKETESAEAASNVVEEPLIAAAAGPAGEPALKKVTVEVSAAKPAEGAPRRRRVRLNPAAGVNEPGAKGTAEGTA